MYIRIWFHFVSPPQEHHSRISLCFLSTCSTAYGVAHIFSSWTAGSRNNQVLTLHWPSHYTSLFVAEPSRAVCSRRLQSSSHSVLNSLHSDFCFYYSTKTALLRATRDLFIAKSTRHFSVLIVLDLSVAFEIVDHLLLKGLYSLAFQNLTLLVLLSPHSLHPLTC